MGTFPQEDVSMPPLGTVTAANHNAQHRTTASHLMSNRATDVTVTLKASFVVKFSTMFTFIIRMTVLLDRLWYYSRSSDTMYNQDNEDTMSSMKSTCKQRDPLWQVPLFR